MAAQMEPERNPKIEPFSGKAEDFISWRNKFRLAMLLADCSDIVAPGVDPVEPADVDEKRAFNRRKNRVFAYLVMAMDKETATYIEHNATLNDGRDAWNKFLAKYKQDDVFSIRKVREQLENIKLGADEDLDIFCNRVETLALRIREIEPNTLSDKMVIGYVVKSVAHELPQWVYTQNKATVYKDVLKELRELEVFRKVVREAKQAEDEALAAATERTPKGSNNDWRETQKRRTTSRTFSGTIGNEKAPAENQAPQSQTFRKRTPSNRGTRKPVRGGIAPSQRRGNKDDECFNCGKTGHWARDCRYKSRERRDANIADEEYDLPDYGTFHVEEIAQTAEKQGKMKLNHTIWTIDSGASSHMSYKRELFDNLEPIQNQFVSVADGGKAAIEGKGSIFTWTTDSKGKPIRLELTNTLYIPALKKNLISVPALLARGNRTLFDGRGSTIQLAGKNIFINLIPNGKLLVLETHQRLNTISESNKNTSDSILAIDEANLAETLETWHKRMGHADPKMIQKLPESVTGIQLKNTDFNTCENCIATKMTKIPFNSSTRRATKILELVHTDISGPMRTPAAISGHKYAINFIDDYSRLIKVYTLEKKSDALKALQRFIAEVGQPQEMSLEIKKIGAIRSDNGGEYTSKQFEQFCLNNGIKRELTIPHTPEQNGVAERAWRTIAEMARAMLKEKSLDPSWWGRAFITAAYIRNRCLSSALPDGVTPYERFTGQKPDLSNIHVFGCKVYYLNESPTRGKLDDKALEGTMMGYADRSKGFIILTMDGTLKISRNVKFIEKHEQAKEEPTPIDNMIQIELEPKTRDPDEQANPGALQRPPQMPSTPPRIQPQQPIQVQSQIEPQIQPQTQRGPIVPRGAALPSPPRPQSRVIRAPAIAQPDPRSTNNNTVVTRYGRTSYPPLDFWKGETVKTKTEELKSQQQQEIPQIENPDDENAEYALMINAVANGGPTPSNNTAPNNFKDANESHEWKKAMEEEYNSLIANDTWTLTKLPNGRKPIGSKWIYKLKENADGSIAKHKARLVAKGYTQTYGVDYKETFAPVTKSTTIRTMLALAALFEYEPTQADISTAYLHANMEEDIYMEQPEGFVKYDENGTQYVCKLNKSIYGLKQSGRNWNKLLDKWFKDHEFEASKIDPCLYIHNKDGHFIAIAIYVDDLLILDNNKHIRDTLINDMQRTFKLVDLGLATWILGMEINYRKDSIVLDQSKYLKDVLNKFNMTECKTLKTPIVTEQNKNPEHEHFNQHTYMSLIGSLIYLSTGTRPDIAYAVSRAGQHMQNPTIHDWIAAKRILRYLKGTATRKLNYSRTGNATLTGYSDSDWAGDLDKRRSTTGYLFTLAGAAISWSSRKQQTIALSSTEAEYMAACAATQEAMHLRGLLKDFGIIHHGPTTLFMDNQGAIVISNDSMTSKRSKHIDIKYHYVRERIEEKDIATRYINTEDMAADCLTKPVGHQVLARAIPTIFGKP